MRREAGFVRARMQYLRRIADNRSPIRRQSARHQPTIKSATTNVTIMGKRARRMGEAILRAVRPKFGAMYQTSACKLVQFQSADIPVRERATCSAGHTRNAVAPGIGGAAASIRRARIG